VEKISTLQENNYKKFKVETKATLDPNYFNISGVNNLEVKDTTTSFLFRGNINAIMKKLADIELVNLWIEEPDLEEIFMHYYEKEA
jgi:ABC-2 type transport system ATP-binding protein